MPLTKRLVFSPTNFSSPDQLQDHEAENTLQAHSFCKMLGSMRQLAHLSAYALEVFHHLTQLTEDVDKRTKALARKTETVYKKLADVEKGMRIIPLQPDIKVSSYSSKYLKGRHMMTPPIFIRSTNHSSVLQQYKSCRNPPQLWRIENMIGEDCFQFFSYPGYFFQEWLRSELLQQEAKKKQRKKDRALRKQMRKEKKRLREQALVSKYQSTQRIVSLKKRALVVEATVAHAEDYNQESEELNTALPQEEQEIMTTRSPPPPAPQQAPVPPSPLKKAGMAAVFGFLAAKDTKKKPDEEDDADRSGDELATETAKLANTTTSNTAANASNVRPSLTKADSMSMQLLGKLESKPDERTATVKWTESAPESAPRVNEEDDEDDTGQWNNTKTSASNNNNHHDIDTEDIAKHFHISMNRRQARNQVSSKRAAKFLSKAPKEGEKSSNLLVNKKMMAGQNEIEIADYAPVNVAMNASPVSSTRKMVTMDDNSSMMQRSDASSKQSQHHAPSNAKKRASVIGVVGLSQLYHISAMQEGKERDRSEELLESIMANIMQDDHKSTADASVDEQSFSKYPISVEESYVEEDVEMDNFTDQFSAPESKPRSSFPDDPPEDEDFLDEMPVNIEDELDAPEGEEEDGSLPPPSEFDELPESEFGDELQSLPSVPSSKPSTVGSRPPPPPPPKPAPKSALNMDVLSQIKGGVASLRTVEEKPRERVVDLRTGLMNSIKTGGANLRNVAPVAKPKFISSVRQNEAVAAILANRSKIAGSDSESDSDSDSDYTDDDYG